MERKAEPGRNRDLKRSRTKRYTHEIQKHQGGVKLGRGVSSKHKTNRRSVSREAGGFEMDVLLGIEWDESQTLIIIGFKRKQKNSLNS